MTDEERERMEALINIDGPLTVSEAIELRDLEQKWRWAEHYTSEEMD
jgi:hypothetical protein